MMKEIKLTDIKGVKVGQYENQEAATGCSVVIVENGATAGEMFVVGVLLQEKQIY